MIPASALFGFFGCGLLAAILAAKALRLQRLALRARIAVLFVFGLAVFVPLGDLPAAAYVRGVTGDLSMTTLVLAGAACIAQVTGRTATGQRDARALLWLVVAAAAFLYPFALGLTYFDPYALGFGSVEFLTVLLLIALAAWWARLYLIVFIVLAAALAYLAGAYESRNLWDYLIDPLVSFYALVRLPAAMRR